MKSSTRLLEARRPRAAFQAVHFALKEVETSHLKRLLHEIGTCDFEPAGTYQLDAYYISSALNILQEGSGVTPDEMARLEFQFIRALDHTEHGYQTWCAACQITAFVHAVFGTNVQTQR